MYIFNQFFKTYRWCTRLECGRSWVRGRVQPIAIKLAIVASPLSTHSKEKKLEIRIIVNCYFSERAQ